MASSFLFHLHTASLRRGSQSVLENFSWQVNPGESWGIVGPTGSGKTTLLQALARRVPLQQGRLQLSPGLRVVSVPTDFQSIASLGQAFQYYQQRFNSHDAELAPTVQAWLQGQARPVGTFHAASVPLPTPTYSEAALLQAADRLQIRALLSRRLTSLSNGEARRTLLTYALLQGPDVLLLDNPFAGLDTDSRQRLHTLLNDLMQQGVSLVMATTPQHLPAGLTHVLTLPPAQTATAKSFSQTIACQQHKAMHDFSGIIRHFLENPPETHFEYPVQLRDVSIRYGQTTVLDRVSWAVRRGEKWAVLGPNGSGKSTLLSLITADNPQAYAHDVRLFDRRRGTGESIWQIKARIGFVSPELHLYFPAGQTVQQVLASGLFDTMGLHRRLTPAQQARTQELLAGFGLAAAADRPFRSLSVGQQRLLLLARALIKNPPLLVLDEPCQHLDDDQRTAFRELIDALCENTERTLLYVSHLPEEIPACVSHTLQLAAGRACTR